MKLPPSHLPASILGVIASAIAGCAMACCAMACGPSTPQSAVVAVPGSEGSAAAVERAPTAQPTAAPANAEAIVWETSEIEARSRAKALQRPLVVFLCAQWAASAAKMDRVTWSDPRVIARVRSFIALRIDYTDADVNAQANADVFDLNTMPSTIVYDGLGHEVARLEGFAGPNEVLAALTRLEMIGD